MGFQGGKKSSARKKGRKIENVFDFFIPPLTCMFCVRRMAKGLGSHCSCCQKHIIIFSNLYIFHLSSSSSTPISHRPLCVEWKCEAGEKTHFYPSLKLPPYGCCWMLPPPLWLICKIEWEWSTARACFFRCLPRETHIVECEVVKFIYFVSFERFRGAQF